MKRVLLVAAFALAATAGTPSNGYAGGAFGLFYCPHYCSSYCQACCPVNAFSSNGCLIGCCPPPMWPQTGYGGGGCGSFMPHYGPSHWEHNPGCHKHGCGHKGCGHKGFGHGGSCGHGGCAMGPGYGAPGGSNCGPCCANKTPHALQLVTSSPQRFGPGFSHRSGMESYGNGGLRNHAPCKGGSCAGESGGNGFQDGPMVSSYAPPEAPAVTTVNQNAANYQQVSYQGYYYPTSQSMPAWGYGYGYYPNYAQPTFNPAAYGW